MTDFYPPRFIESDELLMRPLVNDDAQELYDALLGDPAVTEWLAFPTHRHLGDSLNFIELCRNGWAQRKRYTWILQDKTSQHIVAAIDLKPTLPRVEIGVITSCRPDRRRRRAGLQTLRQFIGWLMTQPQILRLDAYCAPQGAAASTMGKLGFSLEGRLVNWEARPNRNLPAGDSLVFAMTRAPVPAPATVPLRIMEPAAAPLADLVV